MQRRQRNGAGSGVHKVNHDDITSSNLYIVARHQQVYKYGAKQSRSTICDVANGMLSFGDQYFTTSLFEC